MNPTPLLVFGLLLSLLVAAFVIALVSLGVLARHDDHLGADR